MRYRQIHLKSASALMQNGTDVSIKTAKRRKAKDFGLKAFKPATKSRLTPAMKLQRIQFEQQHVNWTSDQWSRVLFVINSVYSNLDLKIIQFGGRQINDSMIHTPNKLWNILPRLWYGEPFRLRKQHGFFLPPGTIKNGSKYLELLKNKL